MPENKDLVEINLNTRNSKLHERASVINNNMSLCRFKEHSSTVTNTTIPYKQGLLLFGTASCAPKGDTKLLPSIFGGSSV